MLEGSRLIDHSTDGFFRLGIDEGLTDVNPGFLDLLGYPRDEIIGDPDFYAKWLHPGSLEEFLMVLEMLSNGAREFAAPVLEFVKRDGESFWAEMMVVGIPSDEGRAGVEGYIRDVTQHVHVTELLSRRTREQSILLQVQRDLLAHLDLQYTLDSIVEKARELMKAVRCTIFLLDDEGRMLQPRASSGPFSEEILALKLQVGEGITGWVVANAKPQRVDHTAKDKRSFQVGGTPDADEGLICAPLITGEKVVGALTVSGGPGQFADDDLDFLVALAQVASIAVANSRLFEEVQRLATTDDLTGAYNRNYFDSNLAMEMQRARRFEYSLGLMIVDVDDLKGVNDSYGHLAGDALLRAAVRRIREGLRGTDWVARYGGDEFAVVLPGCSWDQLEVVGRKISEAISAATIEAREGHRIAVSASIGAASFPENAIEAQDLIRAADDAEMEAKRQGGNQFVVARRGF